MPKRVFKLHKELEEEAMGLPTENRDADESIRSSIQQQIDKIQKHFDYDLTDMNTTTELLDHGYIRLVDFMGDDLSIVRSARISHDADWRDGDDEKLLRYMLEHNHTTPFEAVTITFEVKAPIFVFRQWHRHRTQSYNESSARYNELSEEFYVPTVDVIGTPSKVNKQGRDFDAEVRDFDADLKLYTVACEQAFTAYKTLLASGWPRELARGVLPVATYSRMFATANLHNWLRFLTLRTDPGAQWEIRQYALALQDMLHTVVPLTMQLRKELNHDTKRV